MLRSEDPFQVLLAVVLPPLGANTLLENPWSCNEFWLRREDPLQVLLAVVLLPLVKQSPPNAPESLDTLRGNHFLTLAKESLDTLRGIIADAVTANAPESLDTLCGNQFLTLSAL